MIKIIIFCACILFCSAIPALRLKIDGSKLIDPSGKSVVLTGFNWVLSANHTHEGEGKFMKEILPGTNVVRLVGILWDNSEDPQPGSDCMTSSSPYFDDKCFAELDYMIAQATKAGIWVILTMRGAAAATDVFNDPELRERLYTMWKHVASYYKDRDYIAAYEIMSEPRDKSATPQQIREFYAAGCAATQTVDPNTPCMVGPGPYYKLWHFDGSIILSNNTNVIYTFDYFMPERYAFGKEQMPTYPGVYECKDLYRGCSPITSVCCTGQHGGNEQQMFNASWNAANFDKWPVALRETYNVPVFMNQWGVVHGINASAGRYAYISDTAKSLQEREIGWAWWVWRGGGGDTWAHGSMEFIYDHANGTVEVDQLAVAAVKPFM